jgi:hypothetical protein
MVDFHKIEESARDLQRELWNSRKTLVAGYELNVKELLAPETACLYLGIRYLDFPGLGQFGQRGDRFETAGMLDRRQKLIAVSQKFGPAVMRFTGAHEVGHWRLHESELMHRDRPIAGLSGPLSRPRTIAEQEADYFAACFLVPRKQLLLSLLVQFDSDGPIHVTEKFARGFLPQEAQELLREDANVLDCALVLASARQYGGRRFDSLADQYQVSVPTMAIRLQEAGLVYR